MAFLSNPVGGFTFYMVVLAVGQMLSKKTKGVFSEALFLCIVYATGFIFGWIPTNTLEVTGIPALMSAFGIMLLVTNLGTMIELRQLIAEWKTVAVCLGGLLIMVVLFATVGWAVFGREYALTAMAPVSGAAVATSMINTAAEAAGKMEFAAFASLICSLQVFVGAPLSTILLRKYCDRLVKEKDYRVEETEAGPKLHLKLIKHMPESLNGGSMMVARLTIVMLLSFYVSAASGGALPSAVVALVLGIVATELGFLEPQTLTKAGYMNFLIAALIVILPHGFRTLTLESLTGMLPPIIFFLLLGAAGLMLGGAIIGKLLKMNLKLAASVSLSAMFGYPMTQIVVENVVASFDIPEDEKEKLSNMVLPQMIIAGFTTVTIASVVLAGIVAPMIFK